MKYVNTVLRNLAFAIAAAAVVNLSAEEVLTVTEPQLRNVELLGPELNFTAKVSNYDTETGEYTAPTRYFSRSAGRFTAMTRDAAGVLYAIQSRPLPKLVTINEETGIATDVAIIQDAAGSFFQGDGATIIQGIPAISFVGGELFAIIKREFPFEFFPEGDAPPSIDTGFILVTINLETGLATETGIPLEGQYDGQAHGLAYDPTLGLVHFADLNGEGDEPFGNATVEIIDTVAEDSELVEFFAMSEESQEPGGFQGVASLGGGEFLIYDNSDWDSFFALSITEVEEAPPVGEAPPVEPAYVWDAIRVPFDEDSLAASIYGVRAMSTTESGDIVVDHEGQLEFFGPDGNEVSPSVLTSVGGFPITIRSLATNPVTGETVALTRDIGESGRRRKRLRSALAKDGEEGRSGAGLIKIVRDGSEQKDVANFDLEFVDPEDFYLARDIIAITFDENGNLYGFAEDAEFFNEEEEEFDHAHFLVKIDLASGAVSPVANLGENLGYGYQLEYNPEDGFFYILYYDHEGEESSALALVRVAKDGSVTPVELSGDVDVVYDSEPGSLVFVGLGKFLFTLDYDFSCDGWHPEEGEFEVIGEPSEEAGSLFFELTSAGVVTLVDGQLVEEPEELEMPLFSEVVDFVTGLARVGSFAKGDVAIGEKPSRLRGKKRFSSNGSGQSIRVKKKTSKRLKANYFASVENGGNYPGVMQIRGTKGRGKTKISYRSNDGNVTASVAKGSTVNFGAGSKSKVKITVSQRKGKRLRLNGRLSATYGKGTDLAKAKVQVSKNKRSGGGSAKPSNLF